MLRSGRRIRLALRAAVASVVLAAYTAVAAVAAALALAPAALRGGPSDRRVESVRLARPAPPEAVQRQQALPR